MIGNSSPAVPDPSPSPPDDVRMRGFTRRVTVDDALLWVAAHARPLDSTSVSLDLADGRVLAADVCSTVDVPGFRRAMMDGYAIVAEDSQGAAPYNRLPLVIQGEVLPGQQFTGRVERGSAVRIMTGAPLPDGADAVLPAEMVEEDGQRILAHGSVPPMKHVGQVGEDVVRGTTILPAGRRLRPQDLGVLSSVGVGQVEVVRRPRVRIVVTGNELLPPGTAPRGCQITDANSPMLVALAARDGADVIHPGIVGDEPEEILAGMRGAAELVVVSGGSSVGREDHAPRLLAEHGQLAIHGIAIRPSSPAGMGLLDDRLVFLLPGNPVSCLCAYDFFAGPAIRALGGRTAEWPYPSRSIPLARKLVSVIGRVDYARVTIEGDQAIPLAIGGASVLSSTTRADGFVVIAADSEGFPPGTHVDVQLYDRP